MFKIQVYNNISQTGLDLLPNDRYDVGASQSSPDAALLRSQKLHDADIPANLLAVARAGAGVNNIPLDRMNQAGVCVFNTPGANANAVKELVVAGLLLSCRHLYEGIHFAKTISDDINTKVEAEKKRFKGQELPGKTLAVIGLGAIGVKVANVALALGMRVIGFDPALTVARAWELSSDIEHAETVDKALSQADFVTLHIPANNKTRDFMNAERLQQMPKGSVLLNFARAQVVDEDAVCAALETSQLSHYVTDFPSERLQAMNNVIALPHLGASTFEAEENCAVMAVKQLRKFLEFGLIENSVNLPTIHLDRSPDATDRITIVNRNEPNMVGQITHCLAEEKVNIADMINRSREDLAYTLIDINQVISEQTLAKIQDIDGVIKVRQFPLPAF
jgi:D-3-phosphoglycerate dehydrogenase / 2-oxoglutarate reductase